MTGKYKLGEPLPKNSRAADDRISSFINGSLTKENLLIVEELKLIADDLHMSTAQLVLTWCLRLSEISSTIIGATSISPIEDNRKASGLKIPAAGLEKIDDLLKNKVRSRGSIKRKSQLLIFEDS